MPACVQSISALNQCTMIEHTCMFNAGIGETVDSWQPFCLKGEKDIDCRLCLFIGINEQFALFSMPICSIYWACLNFMKDVSEAYWHNLKPVSFHYISRMRP